MRNPLNDLDRVRERNFRWLPAWLDDRDWKTWLWHTAATLLLGFGLTFVGLSWATGAGVFAFLYTLREYLNVRDLQFSGQPLKPLDHVMDIAGPWLAVVALAVWR